MKTLSKLVIASSVAAALFSTNAISADNDTQLVGQIAAVCEAKVMGNLLNFGQGIAANEDFSVEYTADLTEATSGLGISLTTSPGVGLNDEYEEQTLSGSLALAGGVTALLEVTIA